MLTFLLGLYINHEISVRERTINKRDSNKRKARCERKQETSDEKIN